MSALQAALLIDQPGIVFAFSTAFLLRCAGGTPTPCPFEDGTVTRPDQPAPRPLTIQQMEHMLNLVVPEGVIFSINGQTIAPGTRVNDALEQFGYDNDYSYPEEQETCEGCLDGLTNSTFHMRPGGCLL